MSDPAGYTPFTVPRTYQPRYVPFLGLAALFCLVGIGFGVYFLSKPPLPDQVPTGFYWEGSARGWVDRSWWQTMLPSIYGIVTSLLLGLASRRTAPKSVARIHPPTPWTGIADHLARAAAASLLALTAAYMAFIGMAIQIALVHVAAGQLLVDIDRGFNNTWFMAGLLAYLGYAGLILLAFNRDAKRGQYGDIALDPGAGLPPSHGPAERHAEMVARRKAAMPAPLEPQPKGFVD